jgi:uncharacterized protein
MTAPQPTAAVPDRMRFALDPWVSDFAPSTDHTATPPPLNVDVDAEMPAGDWEPVDCPASGRFTTVRFVDGVQSTDAMIGVDHIDGTQVPGLVGSWAAGVVCCTEGEDARIDGETILRRGVFSAAQPLEPISLGGATWEPRPVEAMLEPDLANALRRARSELEQRLCLELPRDPSSLLVIDGPMHDLPRAAAPWAVGMAKRQHRSYLPADLQRMLRTLKKGQRTPLFKLGGEPRWSWYVCLDDFSDSVGTTAASVGVVRMETDTTATTTAPTVAAFADRVTATLPRFATLPYEDPRAPANLRPIKGLEQVLKRQLGDKTLLRKLLRSASAASHR